MPSKTITILEPVADDVTDLIIKMDGKGNLIAIDAMLGIGADDPLGPQSASVSLGMANLPAQAKSAVTSLVAQALQEFKTQHLFTP